jgi:phosphopantothenoylcysteine decarboxylase
MVIAPLSANTLAKISHGQCDNLLTCVVRAWDFALPLIVAPAMNTLMWTHPFTEQQLNILRTLGVSVIPPISKVLACGDIGTGAMASVDDIVGEVKSTLSGLAQQSQPVTSALAVASEPQ